MYACLQVSTKLFSCLVVAVTFSRGIVTPLPKSTAADLELSTRASADRAARKKRAAESKAAQGPPKSEKTVPRGLSRLFVFVVVLFREAMVHL